MTTPFLDAGCRSSWWPGALIDYTHELSCSSLPLYSIEEEWKIASKIYTGQVTRVARRMIKIYVLYSIFARFCTIFALMIFYKLVLIIRWSVKICHI